jgi:hypothetical protein
MYVGTYSLHRDTSRVATLTACRSPKCRYYIPVHTVPMYCMPCWPGSTIAAETDIDLDHNSTQLNSTQQSHPHSLVNYIIERSLHLLAFYRAMPYHTSSKCSLLLQYKFVLAALSRTRLCYSFYSSRCVPRYILPTSVSIFQPLELYQLDRIPLLELLNFPLEPPWHVRRLGG